MHPRCLESTREWLEVGEITEAIRTFTGSIEYTGWSDEELDRYAGELEDICRRLQAVAPLVYYGEAVAMLRRNARRHRQ
ncbi:hypothetical protein [Lentzea aerocolonigenes]|uniref:hypothetical protein n=1 Tax=Lentzea aerocolonigenes TaxID=68170 RepID=UPI001F2DEE3A|nr:hypothetical protein [Lentzea aerocolonigenes]